MLIGFPRFATVVHTLSAFTSSRLPVAHVAESWSRSSRLTAVPYSLEGSRGCEIKVDYRGYHYMGIRGLGTHLRKMKVNGEQEVITKCAHSIDASNKRLPSAGAWKVAKSLPFVHQKEAVEDANALKGLSFTGDTLLVDGLGWAHHILGKTCRVDHGGDYDRLHQVASRQIGHLRDCGINVRIFKDGNSIYALKVAKVGSRVARLVKQYATLYGETARASRPGEVSSSGGSSEDTSDDVLAPRSVAVDVDLGDSMGAHDSTGVLDIGSENGEWIRRTIDGWQGAKDYPKPRLLTQQLFATLQDAGVELVLCNGEADIELARASAADPSRRTFILGSDNDFLFFDKCRYLTFGSMELTADGVTAPVWTRAHLARSVGLTEKQVVEWALLVGNDFTEAIYDAVEFHDLPEMMLRRGRSPHETLWWLRTQHPDFQVKADLRRTYEAGVGSVSNVEYANMALDFSRALYELEPVEKLIDRWGGLLQTSGAARSCHQPGRSWGGGDEVGGYDELNTNLGGDRDGTLCAGGVREQQPMACMWPPFRYAPASLAGFANTYGFGFPPDDDDAHGDTEAGDFMRHTSHDGDKEDDEDGGDTNSADKPGRLSACFYKAELLEKVMERPWGDIALEAIRATVMPRGNHDQTWVEADEAQTVALFWCALGKRKNLANEVQLTWRDIAIALNYQGHLWRLYRDYRYKNPHLNAPMPCAHFHGPTFHAAARDFRRYAKARVLENRRVQDQERSRLTERTGGDGGGRRSSSLTQPASHHELDAGEASMEASSSRIADAIEGVCNKAYLATFVNHEVVTTR